MTTVQTLKEHVFEQLKNCLESCEITLGQLTVEVNSQNLRHVCQTLRDDPVFSFEMLIDVCGVDYLDYGVSFWETNKATEAGFSRGVEINNPEHEISWKKPRFAVVYHLLSITHNHRIRIRTFAEGEPPTVPSVVDIWNSANWFEREAFDLYGIIFDGHPDLRRILTDYGFIGHPFRKDFPVSGYVEMRYDPEEKRVVYQPVTIEPREITPRVIREDRYGGLKH